MKIIKVNYNQGEYTEGCETCDYGSSYITNLEIITDYAKFLLNVIQCMITLVKVI